MIFLIAIYTFFICAGTSWAAVGSEALSNDHIAKSVVQIFFTLQGKFVEACSGEILAEDAVGTAAHCGRLGQMADEALIRFIDPKSHAIIDTRKGVLAVNPEKYNLDNGDLRVIAFRGGLPKGFQTVPICKSPPKLDDKNASVQLYGYGVHDPKLDLDDLCPGMDECAALNENPAFIDTKLRVANGRLEVSHGPDGYLKLNLANGTMSCHGDSGAPIFFRLGGETCWVGTVSEFKSGTLADACAAEAGVVNVTRLLRDKNHTAADLALFSLKAPLASSILDALIKKARALLAGPEPQTVQPFSPEDPSEVSESSAK